MNGKKKAFIASGAIAAAIITVAAVTGGSHETSPPAATPPAAAPVAATSTAPAAPPAPVAPQYTPSQQQAIDAAESYLSDGQGFSRAGLIQQLHSSFGNGFSRADARFAVNHVQVNWDQQAALAAAGYMSDGQGFSASGLIQQLSSSYGNGFTQSQARFGARSVGL